MHGMNQTEAEYSRHSKRSQRASWSQIGPVVGIGGRNQISTAHAHNRSRGLKLENYNGA